MQLSTDFNDYTRHLLGRERYDIFARSLDDDPPTSIRLNPLKLTAEQIAPIVGDDVVDWCALGRYLNRRPQFTFDPLMHAGYYYVQEASSMFLARVIGQYVDEPVVMLDMCAAPGGKSSLARCILPDDSLLIANEPIRTRANILAENMQKTGHPSVIVTNNYPAEISRSGIQADVILCDVPCSGEGMFRKDEGAIAEWSVQNVEKCWRLQREIVTEAWKCLNVGGLLIYSTCTFNTKENEENVRWICDNFDAEVLPVDTEKHWQITGSLLAGFAEPVYRFIPGFTRGEGLFMAAVRKRSGEVNGKKAKKEKATRKEYNGVCCKWVENADNYCFIDDNTRITAIPRRHVDTYMLLRQGTKIVTAGVTVGTIKGKDVIPDHSLALSIALRRDAFPTVDIDYQQAIAYLRKENITLPDYTEKGFVAVRFNGAVLGFMKNIGNRANNLYPQEWKIRSSHTPDEYDKIINI